MTKAQMRKMLKNILKNPKTGEGFNDEEAEWVLSNYQKLTQEELADCIGTEATPVFLKIAAMIL